LEKVKERISKKTIKLYKLSYMRQSTNKIEVLPLQGVGGFLFKALGCLLLWALPFCLQAQINYQNYIVSTVSYQAVSDPMRLTDANSNTTIQYFDGLGRPTQTVQRAITFNAMDLVSGIEYDGFGREYRHWLPGKVASNYGAYVSDFGTKATNTYGGDAKPYTETILESSPLSRPLGQHQPGADWYAHPTGIDYKSNSADEVIRFSVENNQLKRNTNYDPNILYKTIVSDEDGKTSTEFKDKLGQTVLKRQICNGGNVDTYYVYNDLGQLCYVLPPNFIDGMGSTISFDDANVLLKQFGYLYRYDERGNCNFKRLPGCTPIYMVYDKANRMVLRQDGNQRKRLQASSIQWSVTKFDALGRVVFTGLMYRSETDSLLNYKSIRDVLSNDIVTDSYAGFASATALTINYYDNYNFLSSSPSTLAYQIVSGYDKAYPITAPSASGLNATGLLTGTQVYHLDNLAAYETTAIYYDKYGRVVQTRATNHLGGYDLVYNTLDFTGKPTSTYKTHGINGASATITELYTYGYNNAQQPTTTMYSLNGASPIALSVNNYDELGRVSAKILGGIDATTYSYNVRSWTTDIIGNRFSENLYYNSNPLNSNVCFNGNIAGMQWDVPNEGIGYKRAYSFGYDGLNRLTNANYFGFNGSVVGGTTDRYNETFTFDKMGNITNFVRNGLQSNNSTKIYSKVDDLVLEHVGNQLTRITDSGTNGSFYGDEEFFKNTNVSVNSCSYDANGNRLYDSNSNIWGIRYNLLNLPDAMQFYQGHQTNYTYSATGAKLKVIDKTAPPGAELPVTSLNTVLTSPSVSMITTTDYVGNMIYENGTLKRILTPVGYWQAGTYYYFLKDHLGSNRVVMTGSGGIAETSSYYPSGMRFGESSVILTNSVQPYRHTGHEMQEMHGLNWVDNLARFRTVSDGSGFTGIDQLCEKYYSISPYSYCADNPVKYVDSDGRDLVVLNAPKGAHNAGHMAMLIQNSNGTWSLWSKNGTTKNGGLSGPNDKKADKGFGSFKSPEDFMKSNTNRIDKETGKREYTEGYLIQSTKNEDRAAEKGATTELNKDYKVLESNCAQTVQAGLKAAGKNDGSQSLLSKIVSFLAGGAVGETVVNKTPRLIYERIKKGNDGKVIK
jgi:hypothetical protein